MTDTEAQKSDRQTMLDKLGRAYRALGAVGHPLDTAHKANLMDRMNNILKLDPELTEYAQIAAGVREPKPTERALIEEGYAQIAAGAKKRT